MSSFTEWYIARVVLIHEWSNAYTTSRLQERKRLRDTKRWLGGTRRVGSNRIRSAPDCRRVKHRCVILQRMSLGLCGRWGKNRAMIKRFKHALDSRSHNGRKSFELCSRIPTSIEFFVVILRVSRPVNFWKVKIWFCKESFQTNSINWVKIRKSSILLPAWAIFRQI